VNPSFSVVAVLHILAVEARLYQRARRQQDWRNLVMDILSIRVVTVKNRKGTSAQKGSLFGAALMT
jgi:hypothetical protein